MNVRNIIGFAFGPISSAVLGLVTIPLMSWYFSQQDIGRIAMLQMAISFGVLLFSLGLDQAYVREWHDAEDKIALLRNTFAPGLFLLLIFLAFALFFLNDISIFLFGISDVEISFLFFVCLISSFISRFLSLILRMQEKGFAYSLSQFLPKLLLLLTILAYIIFGADFDTYDLFFAYTLSILVVFFIFAYNTRKDWLKSLSKKGDINQVKSMAEYSFPLVLSGLVYWGLTAVDKIFLRTSSTYQELGIYSISVNFAAAAAIIQSVFSTIWAPIVFRWKSENVATEHVQNAIQYVFFAVLCVFSIIGMVSHFVDFMLPENYRQVRYILVACMGFPLMYMLSEATGVGINIQRKTKYILYSSIIAFLINALGNYLLVPKYGAGGAAFSTCMSFWCFFVLKTEFSMRVWIKLDRLKLYTFSFIFSFSASFISISEDLNGLHVSLVWAIYFVVVVFLFRNITISLLKSSLLFIKHHFRT